jgi:hypothetical protein
MGCFFRKPVQRLKFNFKYCEVTAFFVVAFFVNLKSMEIKKGFIEITEEECRLIIDERFLQVNFPIKKAIKINSYYDRIKNKEKAFLSSEIQNVIGFSEEVSSLFEEKEGFEKTLMVTYSLLKKHDIIMISDVGLSNESINNFKIIMKKGIGYFENKSVYLVRKKYEFKNIILPSEKVNKKEASSNELAFNLYF